MFLKPFQSPDYVIWNDQRDLENFYFWIKQIMYPKATIHSSQNICVSTAICFKIVTTGNGSSCTWWYISLEEQHNARCRWFVVKILCHYVCHDLQSHNTYLECLSVSRTFIHCFCQHVSNWHVSIRYYKANIEQKMGHILKTPMQLLRQWYFTKMTNTNSCHNLSWSEVWYAKGIAMAWSI